VADTASILQTYFVQAADASPPSRPLPATFTGCKVTPLIDGNAYFGDLTATLATIGTGATPADNAGHFIYIAGWWLGLLGGKVHSAPGSLPGSTGTPELIDTDPFTLDGLGGTNRLIDLLKQKARAGVDVRVLGWVSWAVMASAIAQSAAVSIRDVNVGTLASLHALRQEPALAKQCCLNIISHTAGAVHAKLVVAGTPTAAVGYTGGIDLQSGRHGPDLHAPAPAPNSWHDVQAKVEGSAVQALYDFYAQMWNEVVSREARNFRLGKDKVPSHVAGTPKVTARSLPTTALGNHHVQSLRTAPQFKYTTFNILPEGDPISFAPQGLFEVELAWRKAILAANQYIYMEDQGFWSVDVFKWIKEALQNHTELKVILVAGVSDPNDPQLPPYNVIALQDGLLPLTPAQLARVRIYGRNVVMHAKTTLIDDHWAIIGSANCMRRSLYTDVEHSVAMVDDLGALVREYRVQLWGGHFELVPEDRPKLDNLAQALNVWEATWGAAGSGVTRPSHMRAVTLPPPAVTLSDAEKEKYDRYMDPDSRNEWGGCLP
jgi:phosphatidylserine/phosphatidylglycerophosphate/cardiolipin synthase-like enzyme